MALKQISIRLPEEFIKTSQKLKNTTICTDDGDPLYQVPDKSNNSWHSHVYQMGLLKISQLNNKFQRIIEEENNKYENKNNQP